MGAATILLGVIGRPHGVRGLVHVHSYTADPADLTAYGPLQDEAGRGFRLRWTGGGVAEVSEQVGATWQRVADRDAAARLTNRHLYVARDLLPEPHAEEFYLADLVGLRAEAGGELLGTIVTVHDYGAGASLEVARADGAAPLLVPFTRLAVPEVDLAAGRVTIKLPAERDAGERDAAGHPGAGAT